MIWTRACIELYSYIQTKSHSNTLYPYCKYKYYIHIIHMYASEVICKVMFHRVYPQKAAGEAAVEVIVVHTSQRQRPTKFHTYLSKASESRTFRL